MIIGSRPRISERMSDGSDSSPPPLTRRAAQLSEMGFGEDFDRLQRVLEDNDKDVNRAVEALSASA